MIQNLKLMCSLYDYEHDYKNDDGFRPHYLALSQNSYHGGDDRDDCDDDHPPLDRENAHLRDYATLSVMVENV